MYVVLLILLCMRPSCRAVYRFFRPGKLLISLELLPKENAEAQPVGSGRSDPNQNPYLPPPAGRMKFSFNPFRLSMSLLGPKAFYKVRCWRQANGALSARPLSDPLILLGGYAIQQFA